MPKPIASPDRDAPELLRTYVDPDCGCPVEEWLMAGLELQLHAEPDGTWEVFVDAGEWDIVVPLNASTPEAGREEIFAWVRALPQED